MPDRPLDLTNRVAFGKYIGTIMNRHRSVVGSSAEVRAATNKYTTKKEIDRLYKNFMDSLPKEQNIPNGAETPDLDLSNMEIPIDPRFTAPTVGKPENNDFSQQK